MTRARAVVVLVTCPAGASARRLAHLLIRQRTAACVNIVPGVTSVFRWQGKVDRAREALLVIKTTPARYAALERQVRAAHPYTVPEIIVLPLVAGSAPYLRWVRQSVRPGRAV